VTLRTLAAATAAALAALCLPATPSASAATWSTFVLHGDHAASVEITVDTAWRIASGYSFGAPPHTATFAGTYAGFVVERAPDLPGDFPIVVFGTVFVAGYSVRDDGSPDPLQFASWDMVMPTSDEPGEMEAGTFRITLLADGPSEVTIAVAGAGSRDLTPADPVTTHSETADLTQPAGSAAGVRAARLGPIAGGPESFALLATVQHYRGSISTENCLAATRPGATTCPWEADRRACVVGAGADSSDPDAQGTMVSAMFRYPGRTTAGQYVIPAVDPDDTYSEVVEPILQACPWREGGQDAIARSTATSWSTTQPSSLFTLFVRPAPMRSVVERLTGQ
jgi:hypothetical protein